MTDTAPDTQMTDTTLDESTESHADRSPSTAASDQPGGPSIEVDHVRTYLAWGTLAICALLAVFAISQFYGSATDAIDLWVEPRHQPLIHAAFNLVVLLGSLVGISLVLRELQ